MNIVPKQIGWTRSTPSNTIVTLAEMKSICYVDAVITDDDALFTRMELAARNLCEQFLGRPLLTSTTKFYYHYSDICKLMYGIDGTGTPILDLPGGKLQSIENVTTIDKNGDPTVLAAATYYEGSVLGEKGQVLFKESPFPNGSDDKELDALYIDVIGGFGDSTNDVPVGIKQGMEFLIAHWYEHREDQKIGNTITSSAKACWSPYKIQRIK